LSLRAVAVGLKIPDNTAYTAQFALQRLGVAVERVERSEIWFFEDHDDPARLAARVKADETIFNPNKHRLIVLDQPSPRRGEVWIEPLPEHAILSSVAESGPAAIAWRLFGADGVPVSTDVLAAAIERLLCNPAIERAKL
jgi:hypothetical protein